MFTVPEQFSAATKANVDAQLALFSNFSSKAFEGVEKLLELNLSVLKSSLEDSASHTKQLLAAKDAQELINLSSARSQPVAEKVLAYSRELANISSATQAELSNLTEQQIAETNRKVLALFEEVSKNAPQGSEQFVSLFKTSFNNLQNGYEQFSKSAKQAAETLEANVNATVSQLTQAGGKAAPRAAKK